MDTRDLQNLRDLIGFWTCLSLCSGFFCAWLARILNHNINYRPSGVSKFLFLTMLFLALVIELLVVPASMGYSGPVPPEYRRIWMYDKHFGASIAAAFSLVFLFDAIRLRLARK